MGTATLAAGFAAATLTAGVAAAFASGWPCFPGHYADARWQRSELVLARGMGPKLCRSGVPAKRWLLCSSRWQVVWQVLERAIRLGLGVGRQLVRGCLVGH